jgi:hypothetical protein
LRWFVRINQISRSTAELPMSEQEGQQSVSVQLIDYSKYVEAARLLPTRLRRKASAPLLISRRTGWAASSTRILVVGQETNGWGSNGSSVGDSRLSSLDHFCLNESGVDEMLRAYVSFDFASSYSHRNSAFWRAFRLLEAEVAQDGVLAMWTNLFKVDVGGSVVRGCNEKTRKLLREAQAGILAEEVRALDPTAVVFFTGPTYDEEIGHAFDQPEFHALWPDRPVREAAQVISPLLPQLSFRMYHPNYLQRSRRWGQLSKLASEIGNRLPDRSEGV